MNGRDMKTNDELVAFDAQAITVAAGATLSTKEIDLGALEPRGFFAAQVTTAGAGSVLKLEYLTSADGKTFAVPTDKDGNTVDDIVTAHAVGDGYYPFYPPLARFIKIRATVTVADASAVTVKLIVQ